MGFIEDTKQRVVETVFDITPIREARDTAVKGALEQYYTAIKTEWNSQLSEIQKANMEAVNRAFEAGVYEGLSGNDDPATSTFKQGGLGYRPISDKYVRDGKIDYKTAQQAAWDLWQKSPIAKRLLTMKRDHIIGHSAMPSAEDTEITETIKQFWMDNKLDKRASDFVQQLFLFGEQCYPVFVRKADGRVRLGYIDPSNIAEVKKHPENSLEDWAVVVSRYEGSVEVGKDVYRIIRPDEDYIDDRQSLESEHDGLLVTAGQAVIEPWEAGMIAAVKGLSKSDPVQYDGSCFYFKVNAVSNQSRGMSDLLQVADWIDQADEVLFALADKERIANYFVWFIKLISADEATVSKRRREIAASIPKPGGAYVHNDSEEPSLNSPSLNQAGTIETFRAILGLILGGLGYPVHWFGYGDDANRATAVAQSDPTSKSLEHDQGTVKVMLLTLCQFAIDQKSIHTGQSAEVEEYELILDLPEVSNKDISRVAATIAQMSTALGEAERNGWQSQKTSAVIWAKLMSEFDVDIDPEEELKIAKQERAERERNEEQNRNNALNRMLQNGQNGNGVNGRNGSMRELIGVEDE